MTPRPPGRRPAPRAAHRQAGYSAWLLSRVIGGAEYRCNRGIVVFAIASKPRSASNNPRPPDMWCRGAADQFRIQQAGGRRPAWPHTRERRRPCNAALATASLRRRGPAGEPICHVKHAPDCGARGRWRGGRIEQAGRKKSEAARAVFNKRDRCRQIADVIGEQAAARAGRLAARAAWRRQAAAEPAGPERRWPPEPDRGAVGGPGVVMITMPTDGRIAGGGRRQAPRPRAAATACADGAGGGRGGREPSTPYTFPLY